MTASFKDSHLNFEFKFVCRLLPIPSITIRSTLYWIIVSTRSLKHKNRKNGINGKPLETHLSMSRKFKQHPFWPDSLTTRLLVLRHDLMIEQVSATFSTMSESSRPVTSFRLGSEFAHRITFVSRRKSSLTKGITPSTMSTPELSQKNAAQLWIGSY